jgi:two-component system cell cycle sensor histidine kinase/response regulator CckA
MTLSQEPTDLNATGTDPYRELFERSADAILMIDGETFVDCNQATVDMLRYKNKAELLQTHPSELSPELQPDGRASFEKANEMMAIAFEKGSHRFEWEHMRADGEVFPVEVLLTAVPRGDGHILHCVWRDITDRKRLEMELRQAQKMEAIGKLTGGIAHDFNNLLVSILGHAELLKLELRGSEKSRHRVDEIHRAGKRAAALVGQLLTFSRKQVLQPRVLDLNAVLVDLDSMLARLLGEDIQIETRTIAGALCVKADPGQLEQMIMNLATNARDAMPEGGTLTFETSEIVVSGPRPGDLPRLKNGPYAVLSVTDTGVGMPRHVIDKIFDPFFTTKERGKGTGLGLSTVYGLAKQSGGDVTVQSEPGQGTQFRIFLPVTNEPLEPLTGGQATESEVSPGGTETVLVVEDEPSVGSLIESVLTGKGYKVLRAANGEEALDLVATCELDFDLLLTDVVMPRMGGPELAKELRRSRPELKVLFASGYTDNALTKRGALDEGVDLLQKPFSPPLLLRRVREALDRG